MEDSGLIELFFDRDEQAISETDKKYGGLCTTLAKNILGSTEDAQEIKNDTLLALWKSIPPHRPEVLSAFITKTARNLTLNRLRSHKAQKRGGGEYQLALDELGDIITTPESVTDSCEAGELQQIINSFVSQLDVDKQQIFLLRYYYLFSVSEIAKRTGSRQGRIKTALMRLRQALKERLESEGYL